MAKARKTREFAGVAEHKAQRKAKRKARKDAKGRVRAIDKRFKDMTRAEKDELLFQLCLEHGILPKETE